MASEPADTAPHILSPEQIRRRRRRSVALALGLVVLVILIYVVTLEKLGPGIFSRPL